MLMIGSTSYNLKIESKLNEDTGFFENEASAPFLQSFRDIYLLTLGEFDLNDLGTAQWVLFFVATFLLQIMMFNLLIAILSDTFAKVMEEIDESDQIEKNNLIIDADTILFRNRDNGQGNLQYLYYVEYKQSDSSQSDPFLDILKDQKQKVQGLNKAITNLA